MPKVQTPAAFAKAFTSKLAGAVRAAAGTDGRLSLSEAGKMAAPYADNAKNFLEKVGQQSVSVEKLIGRAHDYALATAIRAAGPDGRLSAVDARSLPADLRADLDGINPSPNARADELRDLAPSLSLSSFGEDDSGAYVQFVRRKKPVDKLDADTFLAGFGFSAAKQKASDQFSFAPMSSSDWDNLVESQYDDAGKAAMRRVREVMEPLSAHVAYVEDDRPFGSPVFLLARGAEGEMFGFRATVGGMGF